jgi:hypothetical protein
MTMKCVYADGSEFDEEYEVFGTRNGVVPKPDLDGPDPDMGDDVSEFDDEPDPETDEPREDSFLDDVDADANALAGAGYGTDEDYEHHLFDEGPDYSDF